MKIDTGSATKVVPRGAVFSECGQFRYVLAREWDAGLPTLGYCALNPSIAGDTDEDQSSMKFRGFAERLGYGGYLTCNLYAWISTDPRGLKAAGYPVGPVNDMHIRRSLAGLDVICAWGGNAAKLSRPRAVLSLLREIGARTLALKINSDGTPAHPLYLPCTLQPTEYAP